MTAKKHILFVINNLNVGGAEKALVSMLQVFEYDHYDVDLLLFKKEGLFLKQVPEQVNILEAPANYRYFDMPFSKVIRENLWKDPLVIFRRWQFNQAGKKATSPAEAEQFGWKPLSKTLKALPKNYDAAIGFLEKSPNYFVVDKVDAKVKIGFIHNDYKRLKMNRVFDAEYFEKLHHIVSVSEVNLEVLKENFPQHTTKFIQIKNIISTQMINKLAQESIPLALKKNAIVSVGRLVAQKNYDLTIDALHILYQRNVAFHWYVLGEGQLIRELSQKVDRYGINEQVTFLGVRENPYPYIMQADIFLMTSLFEGDGIAIREAKILQKPIVLTNFNTASLHVKSGFNGFIVENRPITLAEVIEKTLNNEIIRKQLSENLVNDDSSNVSELERLYQLIEN